MEPNGLINVLATPPSNVGVNNIDYNEKGQRTRIDYATKEDGKVISTTYEYDRETFRLVHLYTRRGVDAVTDQGVMFTDDCDNPQPPPPRTIAASKNPPVGKSSGLQNIYYTYDPVGNITHIRDDAQQMIFFNGAVVKPQSEYTYDAIYRLIEAREREHEGHASQRHTTWDDRFRIGLAHPHDGQKMQNYSEVYTYDEVGNIKRLNHKVLIDRKHSRRNNGDWISRL